MTPSERGNRGATGFINIRPNIFSSISQIFFYENEGVFPDYVSEIHNICPDNPVLQILRVSHLLKLSN